MNAPFSLHRLFVLGSVGKTPTHSVTYILMLATEVAHIMFARMWRVRVRNGPHVAARKVERFFRVQTSTNHHDGQYLHPFVRVAG